MKALNDTWAAAWQGGNASLHSSGIHKFSLGCPVSLESSRALQNIAREAPTGAMAKAVHYNTPDWPTSRATQLTDCYDAG